jgi:parallel beta-helix repeat protein
MLLVPINSAYSNIGVKISKNIIIPTNRGNTLYVGGNGSNNYTTIQSAINDAVDGDTVFVYNDSSPYYEKVIVNKSIKLIGEDINTTVIDGNGKGYVVTLKEDEITLSGFTIQKSGPYGSDYSGLRIFSNFNTINDNMIINNAYGIFIIRASNNNISNNIISNNDRGVIIYEKSDDNIITKNTIINNTGGIKITNPGDLPPYNNIISMNNIKDNQLFGISIEDSSYTTIYKNNIENSEEGIFLFGRGFNSIKCNNFINLEIDAFFSFSYFNRWNRNYWGRTMFSPKVINGYIVFFNPWKEDPFIVFEWFNYDLRPAKKPYDITITNNIEGCDIE